MGEPSLPELLTEKIILAQQGNREVREELIAAKRSFVLNTCSRVCRRALDWNNDDELSVGLLALNEAIDSYDPGKGTGFEGHAGTVIHRRLVDHFRREERARRNVFLDQGGEDEEGEARELPAWEEAAARERYTREEEARDRVGQIALFVKELAAYGLTLDDLVGASPHHRDTRESLVRAARVLAGDPEMLSHLRACRQVPLVALSQRCGLSRRILERGRRYIVAMTLILVSDEYPSLRYHLRVSEAGHAGGEGG